MGQFNEINTMKFWCQKVLPLVYDDSLSYYDVLNKVVKKLNELVENNKNLPQYIADLIQSYITSGAIADVIHNILTDYMLNVKNPPSGLKSAVGDGTADDTQAIQGCIDYALANGGKAVYFPSGVYLTQSLTLKEGVSLFGFDPNTTRLVLKGGATRPMLYGVCSSNTIKGLTFDGNADIQVNDIDLIELQGGKYIIDSLILTDGHTLLKVELNNNGFLTNIRFDKAVKNGMVITGNGQLVADNLIVNSLSALIGESAITLNCDNCIVTNLFSKATVGTPIIVNSSNNYVNAKIFNYSNPYIDNGGNNSFDINGVTSKEQMTGSKTIIAKEFIIDIINPITYRTPTDLNTYFKTIPFKDKAGVGYDVLVKGSKDIDQTFIDVNQAISGVANSVVDERNAREQEDSNIRGEIENEVNSLNISINKKANVFLSVAEPIIDVNENSLWFEINGSINCGGDGVSIGNAETGDVAPNDVPYWFDPIEESEVV